MTKHLFVGQRVRWTGLWEGKSKPPSSRVGVITGGPECCAEDGTLFDWEVTLDCGRNIVENREKLEPITDRNEVVTWESCAWSPHGVDA
jgi:hypothetical protein